MDQDFKITPTEHYLLVEFTGQFEVDSAKRSVDALVESCIKTKNPKVLFDIRSMTGDLSTLDRYRVGQYGSDTITRTTRFAMLARADQVSPDKFFENIAVNRGLNLKVFTNIDETVAWLKE